MKRSTLKELKKNRFTKKLNLVSKMNILGGQEKKDSVRAKSVQLRNTGTSRTDRSNIIQLENF